MPIILVGNVKKLMLK